MRENITELVIKHGKNSNLSKGNKMAGEIFEKYYDPDDRENSWADTEPKTKMSKDIGSLIGKTETKNQIDSIEDSLKNWHDGDITPEVYDSWTWPLVK